MVKRRRGADLAGPDASRSRLDVSAIRDPLARSRRWDEGVRSVFDGVQVRFPAGVVPEGKMATYGLGPGRIAGIRGGPQHVTRRAGPGRSAGLFNVLMQLESTCEVRHAGTRAALRPGDLCLVDGASGFELRLGPRFNQLLFQLPRDMVLRRYDTLGRRAGERMATTDPAARAVFETFAAIAAAVPTLDAAARTFAFEACLAVLGLLHASSSEGADLFARVAAEVEAELSDPELSAERLARRHGLSRRRLDQVFATHGTTVTAYLRARRLERVAVALRDPGLAYRHIIDLAFSHGFSDAAHFSRLFRRRFGTSPRDWRAGAEGAPLRDR